MVEHNKIILIGDIQESKKLSEKERQKLQDTLDAILKDINSNSKGLISPLTITLGDEIQGIYKTGDELLNHIWRIMAELYPAGMRFSIGVGRITTPINYKQAIGMDGPGFHVARDGIEELKKSGFLFKINVAEKEDAAIRLINASLDLISKQMTTWKKTRFEVLKLLSGGESVKKIAGALGISESAVYKNRDDGSLEIIMRMNKNFIELINEKL